MRPKNQTQPNDIAALTNSDILWGNLDPSELRRRSPLDRRLARRRRFATTGIQFRAALRVAHFQTVCIVNKRRYCAPNRLNRTRDWPKAYVSGWRPATMSSTPHHTHPKRPQALSNQKPRKHEEKSTKNANKCAITQTKHRAPNIHTHAHKR